MRRAMGWAAFGCVAMAMVGAGSMRAADSTAENDAKEGVVLKQAVLAGGCYWCVEAVFEELEGVQEAVSGFAGSEDRKARDAGDAHARGYAEAVRISYDPAVIDYDALLEVFFATHDPTTLNRQGPDVGVEYRSAVFWKNAAEKESAEAMIAALTESGAYGGKRIVTALEELKDFVEARPAHQNYVCNNPGQPYVESVAMEKVRKVREKFKERLKKESPLRR